MAYLNIPPVLESVGSKYRTLIGNLSIAIFYTPAACILPWIAYFCNNWRTITLVTSMPIVISLLMIFLIPESPRWLLSVGKTNRGMSEVSKAAKLNGKMIPEDIMSFFRRCCELNYIEQQAQKRYTVIDLFKTCNMCRITIILIVIWMIIAIVYDAHVRVIVDIGPDVFITFSLANLTEFPAAVIPIFVLDRVGRKPMLLMVLMMCALGSLMAALFQRKWMVAAAAIISRLFVTISYNVGLQWAAEILPTVVRGQGTALIHIMGSVAALVSPFVVYTEHYSEIWPMIILTILSLVGASLVIFLPETKNSVMPQTLQEAEQLWAQKCGLCT